MRSSTSFRSCLLAAPSWTVRCWRSWIFCRFFSRHRVAAARFDLAARKLPEAGEGFALGPLGQEDAPVDVDQRDGRDEDGLHER